MHFYQETPSREPMGRLCSICILLPGGRTGRSPVNTRPHRLFLGGALVVPRSLLNTSSPNLSPGKTVHSRMRDVLRQRSLLRICSVSTYRLDTVSDVVWRAQLQITQQILYLYITIVPYTTYTDWADKWSRSLFKGSQQYFPLPPG